MVSYTSISFLIAAAFFVGARFILSRARRNASAYNSADDSWSLFHLCLASFLTLFAELAFIRWIAVEVRIFAYFKNLALLLCFLGFGLGCALTSRRVRWINAATAFMGLLLAVRLPSGGLNLEALSQTLASTDLQIWYASGNVSWLQFLLAAVTASALMLLLVLIVVPLGQVVSRQMDLAARPLHAYSWNLAASLGGILAFFGACRLMLPPSIWVSAVVVGFAVLQTSKQERIFMASLALPAILLLYQPSTPDHFSVWTPYQQIEFNGMRFPDGELRSARIDVNHAGYQLIINMAPDFLARHPKLVREPLDENPYNLPFRFSVRAPSVMIVGSGAGNDVAAALRNGSRSVDAVEIDPAIYGLGKREHPEHPYDSARVSVHLTDARAFLKRTTRHYDLVVFGLLDSHTQLSDYANMRIDNFVYTAESFREAAQHLNRDGVLFVKFAVARPWMGKRLEELLTQTFHKPPLVFFASSSYAFDATCFVISPSDQVQKALAADPRLSDLTAHPPEFVSSAAVPVTTDDWPYLYQQGRWIPRTFLSMGLLVILIALALYLQIPEARGRVPSLFFFAMGAGFLLLETQVISRLALYFGTTWQVNGIVIGALLTALLAANTIVESRGVHLRRGWIVAGLLGGLLLAYFFPFHRIPGTASFNGSVAAAVFTVPVFFAGLLFALEFRRAESPSAALGANMLGAVAGGLLENLSFITGMHALLLVAIALYCLAALGLRWEKGVPRETPAVAVAATSSP